MKIAYIVGAVSSILGLALVALSVDDTAVIARAGDGLIASSILIASGVVAVAIGSMGSKSDE